MHELVLLLTDYAGNIPSMYRILLTMYYFSAYVLVVRPVLISFTIFSPTEVLYAPPYYL